MVLKSRAVVSVLAICLLAFSVPAYSLSCLLFPLSCLVPKKKYGEEMDALVLDLRGKRTDAYEVRVNAGGSVDYGPMVVADPLQNKRAWYIWFKVGDTLYQAERDETVLQMGYKKPKREDWIGKTVKMRFRDQKWAGIKSAWAVFDRGHGKEWEFVLVSIIGPDGVDECAGHMMCPQQAEVDRAAREQEQLAKLGKAGNRSASDVAPMPVDGPELPDLGAQQAAAVTQPAAAADSAPADAAAQAVEGVPEAGEAATAEGAPATETAPAAEVAPAAESQPAAEPQPAVESAPATPQAPAEPAPVKAAAVSG